MDVHKRTNSSDYSNEKFRKNTINYILGLTSDPIINHSRPKTSNRRTSACEPKTKEKHTLKNENKKYLYFKQNFYIQKSKKIDQSKKISKISVQKRPQTAINSKNGNLRNLNTFLMISPKPLQEISEKYNDRNRTLGISNNETLKTVKNHENRFLYNKKLEKKETFHVKEIILPGTSLIHDDEFVEANINGW